jgi:hypothetical protein
MTANVTLEELKNRIANACDEVDILELLEINSFELVERFEDKILERFGLLAGEFAIDEDPES